MSHINGLPKQQSSNRQWNISTTAVSHFGRTLLSESTIYTKAKAASVIGYCRGELGDLWIYMLNKYKFQIVVLDWSMFGDNRPGRFNQSSCKCGNREYVYL